MRTQQYSQVEAIVTKYETLASNTDRAKAIEKECKENSGFYIPDDIDRLQFGEQLIARIYELRAGKDVNSDVKNDYSRAYSFYINGLLNEEDEKYLVDHFDEFVDYAFEHFSTSIELLPWSYCPPFEWSCLVPYLLENKSGKILIPHSDQGREFVGLNNCDLTVGSGFADAAIRALACGLSIHSHKFSDSEESYLTDFEDGLFNALIADLRGSKCDIQTRFSDFLRIVKDGGDILLCVSKEVALNKESFSLRYLIVKSKTLQEVIQLPSGNVLFHCVKKGHDSVLMCDASGLSKRSNERVVDVDAFQKEVKMADLPEREDCPIIRRYSYDKINENILLPVHYLRPNTGTPLSQIVKVAEDFVLSDECNPSEKVVTVNHLSNVFTKGAFKVEDLASVNLDRMRRYYRVEGPAVIMAVSEQNIAIGYTEDSSSFLVPRNLYALKPQKGIDVKYLASILFNNSVREQLTRLVYGKGVSAKLAFHWSDFTLFELHSEQEQQAIVQNAILEDYASQEHLMALQEKGFKHAIRLRKHALSQNISAFDSLFRTLEHCMSEHKGVLKADEQLSPVSPMTVADAMGILHSNLEVISERVNHLTDDQDWGVCEAIEPQQFIEDYEKHHTGTEFRFGHMWDFFETNYFEKDVFDKKTGKLVFHEGESMNTAWFPRKALQQVFDNIVSNAREHGFTDKSRQDYVIQTSWTTDGLNMLIKVANNGAPLPSDLNTDLVLEYGYTTALNQRGHAGIGGGEMAEIMHKFGGDIRVISTPDKKFTVTYVLSMPLASIY